MAGEAADGAAAAAAAAAAAVAVVAAEHLTVEAAATVIAAVHKDTAPLKSSQLPSGTENGWKSSMHRHCIPVVGCPYMSWNSAFSCFTGSGSAVLAGAFGASSP